MVLNSTHLMAAGLAGFILGVLFILIMMCIFPHIIYMRVWFMVDAKHEIDIVTKIFRGQPGFSVDVLDEKIIARIYLARWFDFNNDRAENYLSESVLPRLTKHGIEVLGSGVY